MADFREFLLLMRRRWRIVIWCITICMSVAYVLAFSGPVLFRSTGTIVIERADIPEELARSTVSGVLGQRLELILRRVVTEESLQPIVDELSLFDMLPPDDRASELSSYISVEQVNPITLEPELGGAAFSVNVDYENRTLVRDIADMVIDLFLDDNRRARTESAAGTERFFDAQGDRLALEITDLEQRIAVFKQENSGLLPDDVRGNQQTLERLYGNLSNIQADIRSSTERRDLLNVQRDEIADGTELAILKSELTAARQIYTDDHPTIRRLLRNIAAIEAVGGDPELQDPDLRRVIAQLVAVEREIAADMEEEAAVTSRIALLQYRSVRAPDVEKRLQELTRDYDLALGEYREIRQKRGDAELAQNLEAEDKGERYTVLSKPRTPTTSFYPNRIGIMLMGIMLALGSGIGISLLVESSDNTVRSSRDVIDAFGGPPIAIIPVIRNVRDSRILATNLGFQAIGLTTAVGLAIAIVQGAL